MPLSEKYSPADVYLLLSRAEKREFEKRVLLNPYGLSTDEMRILYEEGFPFRKLDYQWIGTYLQIVDFYKVNKHINVGDNRSLSCWIQSQRTKRSKGKLLLGRERALNRIHFIWDLSAVYWESRFNEYKAYVQSAGKVKSTAGLRVWASLVRKKWNQLPQDQKQKLEALNFDLAPKVSTWFRNIEELEQVYISRGRLVGLNVRLAKFVRHMRTLYHSNRLTQDQQTRLENAGISWVSRRPYSLKAPYCSIWDMRYDQAKAYIQENSKLPFLNQWTDKTLANWVKSQRFKWNALSPAKQAKLGLLHLEPDKRLNRRFKSKHQKPNELSDEFGK